MFFTKLNIVAITVVALFYISTSAFAQVPTGWEITQNTMDDAYITFSTAAAREGNYGMEIHVNGDYGDSVTFKLNGLDLPWSNDLEIDVKRVPSNNPIISLRLGLWHGDTVIYSLLGGVDFDNWMTYGFGPGAWEAGSLEKIDGFSMTFGYYPGFGTGPKTLYMDFFRLNDQIFYTAGDVGIIQGVVFNDTSGNGIRESEDGLVGEMVYLSGTHTDSVLTDSVGNYKFANLPHGSYTVTSPVASGWVQTKPVSEVYDVTIGPDTLFYIGDFGNHATTAKAFRVRKWWNLLSLPLDVPDAAVTTLYPSALTNAYGYNGSYYQVDTMEKGPSVWIKFGYDQLVFMDGDEITSDTIGVTAGWNLVGGISTPVLVSNVTTSDPGLTIGGFWEYNGSYKLTDTVQASKGYWVNVSQSGSIMMFSNPPSGVAVHKIRVIPDGEMPPSPPEGEIASPADGGLAMTPTKFRLAQNYPNPFNPVTTIGYEIASSSSLTGLLAMTRLVVYDLLGREVAVLVNEVRVPGKYEVQFNASQLPSGVYMYRLQAGGISLAKKLILLK